MVSKKGITLIELLVVILIVGILAAIAIPSYTGYMVRARRADAKVALEQFRAAQEMRRAERGGYATDINELRATWGVPETAGDYTIRFQGGAVLTVNIYTAEAAPWNARQLGDGWLRINQAGVKTSEFPDRWTR